MSGLSNKVNRLQVNANKYGDYQVQTLFLDGRRSKWRSVLEITYNIDKDIWRLKTATDRTLYPCELVLDFDPNKGETRPELIKRVKCVIEDFKIRGISYKLYHTGGNGFHLHLIIWNLAILPRHQREIKRKKIIMYYGSDTNLGSDRHMILLEGEANRKTGVKKHEVNICQLIV